MLKTWLARGAVHGGAILAAALWLAPLTAEAQPSGRGTVVDDVTGEPVAGAEVLVIGHVGQVITDAEGKFVVSPPPRPPFEVIVVLRGGQMMKPILVSEVEWGSGLVLRVQSMLAEEVHVTSGLAPSIDATPGAALTLIPAREIVRRVPANLMQSLENVAGVNQVSEGQAAVPAVRGLAQGRTLILIDGARVTSERRVGPSATYLDPITLEAVDVARGPGSVAYGSDAFGGVISVRTTRPEPNAPLRIQGSGTFGAGVPDRRVSAAMSRGYGSGALLLQGHYRNAEDYSGPEGKVLNSGWQDSGFLVRSVHTLGDGLLSAGLQSDFGRDIERPRNNSAQVRFYYPYENSHRLTASYDSGRALGLESLAANAFWGIYEQRTDQDRYATATTPRSVDSSTVDARDYGFRAVGEKFLARTRLEFGIDVAGRYGLEAHELGAQYDATGAIASSSDFLSIEDASKHDVGLFAQVQGSLGDHLALAGGLRVDFVGTRNEGGYFGDHSTSDTAGSGFGSFTVGPFAGFALTAQYSRGYRDPLLSDRYYRGPTGRGYITGNPELEAETSNQFDFALRYTSGPVRVAAYLYRYDLHDLIERYEAEQDIFFFRNRGSARIRGAELELQLTAGLYAVEIAGQVTRGEALDELGGDLDDMPADSLRLVGRRTIGELGSVYARLALYDDYDRPGPNEIPAPGYVLLDLGATWRFTEEFEIRALGRNLLDEAYYASPVARWVYAPGINGSITAALRF